MGVIDNLEKEVHRMLEVIVGLRKEKQELVEKIKFQQRAEQEITDWQKDREFLKFKINRVTKLIDQFQTQSKKSREESETGVKYGEGNY